MKTKTKQSKAILHWHYMLTNLGLGLVSRSRFFIIFLSVWTCWNLLDLL